MPRRLPVLIALTGAALTLSVSRAEGPGAVERTLDIHVDATRGTDLEIELVATGLQVGKSFYVKRITDPEVYAFTDPVFTTEDGVEVPHEPLHARFTVKEAPAEQLRVRYQVTPGGQARHGMQGLVSPAWAGFDGRAILQPKEIATYDDVRWHFTLPQGWTVASSMLPADNDSWRIPPMEPRYRASVLKSLCVGLGPFDVDTRRLGETDFRVFTYSRWTDGAELAEGAHGVFRWFHEELGFDPGRPFALVWTPPGPDMAPVWSGAGATATCYERPQKGFHNWELLGHRIAHPINEYPPDGFLMGPARDHWFMEGWATYTERPALAASGVAGLDRLNALYAMNLEELAQHPEWADFPLADELQAGVEITENLHYRRGPLVVTMLADQVQRRTGRSFEAFMKEVIPKHRGFQRGFDLRAELEAWAGQPFDDFWAAMVDEAGPTIPVWKEYADTLPSARPTPVLRAGELTWSTDQLVGLFRTGDFEGAVDLAEALRETGRKHAELARRGVSLLPPELAELRAAFPADVRGRVDRLERMWPLEGGPPAPSGGCGGSGPVPLPDLEALGPEGEQFLALVDAERQAVSAPGGANGIGSLRFGIDDWEPPLPYSVAAHRADEKLRVVVGWVAPPRGLHLEVWDGERRVTRKWVEVQSDWMYTWTRTGPDEDVNQHTGLLDVRLVHQGEVVAHRPVWRVPVPEPSSGGTE